MAVALLSATALALAGFVFTSVQGFAVSAGPAAAKTLVHAHVGYAIPTVLLSLFSQSMVIFYFIGTGRLVKDEVSGYPEEQQRAIRLVLSDFKRRTSSPATLALLSAIGVFVLGGAVHTRSLPAWTHLGASLLAVTVHSWALMAEWRVFGENTALMNDPRAYARRAAGKTTSP